MQSKPIIIGVTGNIASGKSVITQYLQSLGAFIIDADVVAQRAMAVSAPGYPLVIDNFGISILDRQKKIDRKVLADIVFKDPNRLTLLESSIHPLVTNCIINIINATTYQIIAIEAIKLIEAGLGNLCSIIWVATAKDEIRLQRLINNRGLSKQEAKARLSAQTNLIDKKAIADAFITTEGSFLDTYQIVTEEIRRIQLDGVPRFEPQQNKQTQIYLSPFKLDHYQQISDFLTKNDKQQIESKNSLAKILAKISMSGIFYNNQLAGLLYWKYSFGYACIVDLQLDNQLVLLNEKLVSKIFSLITDLCRKNFIEFLAYRPLFFRCVDSKYKSQHIVSQDVLPYAYKKPIRTLISDDEELSILQIKEEEEINILFQN